MRSLSLAILIFLTTSFATAQGRRTNCTRHDVVKISDYSDDQLIEMANSCARGHYSSSLVSGIGVVPVILSGGEGTLVMASLGMMLMYGTESEQYKDRFNLVIDELRSRGKRFERMAQPHSDHNLWEGSDAYDEAKGYGLGNSEVSN